MKKILDDLKDLNKNHKIEILTPNYRRNQLKAVDAIISISKSMHVQPLKMHVIKNRFSCFISELIDANEKIKLQEEIDKMNNEILSVINVIQHKMKIENNIIKVLKENKLDYLEILENKELLSKLFKDKKEQDDFYVKIGVRSDNFEYLAKNTNIDDILTEELIDKVIKNRAINIFSELIFFDKFKRLIEENFDVINFIPIMMENQTQEILKICLENIECKQKENIEATFIRFDKGNSLDSEENNSYYFNETMRTLILHSNFKFLESDKKVLTKENIALLEKKKLNENLENKLEEKTKSKKNKI